MNILSKVQLSLRLCGPLLDKASGVQVPPEARDSVSAKWTAPQQHFEAH